MQVWNSWHTGRGVSRRLTADLTVAGVGVGCSQYPRFTDLTVAGVGVGMQSVSEVYYLTHWSGCWDAVSI